MIDPEILDRLYEQTGGNLGFGLFDKRMLLPFEQLPDAVEKETGERISLKELSECADGGWFSLLEFQDGSGRTGVPLYIPSRVGLFLSLRREGYSPEELHEIVRSEEMLVDYVLVDDDMQYLDDDIETLIQYAKRRIEVLTSSNGYASPADATEAQSEQQHLAFLEGLRRRVLDGARREAIAKAVFRVRATDDALRNFQFENERAKVRAGYGPSVFLGRQSWNTAEKSFQGGNIDWKSTISMALAHQEGDSEPPIRVPGFLLRGEKVVTVRTLTPPEYARQWQLHELDEYLIVWSKMRGERRCLHCLGPLPADADARKRFCKNQCRNAAKQRRYRERSPEKADQARRKYLVSLTLDEYPPAENGSLTLPLKG